MKSDGREPQRISIEDCERTEGGDDDNDEDDCHDDPSPPSCEPVPTRRGDVLWCAHGCSLDCGNRDDASATGVCRRVAVASWELRPGSQRPRQFVVCAVRAD